MKIKQLKRILILTVIAISAVCCKPQTEASNSVPNKVVNNQQESKLPGEMPKNINFLFEFKSFTSGSSLNIEIKNEDLIYKKSGPGVNKSGSQKITLEQQKELYQLFVKSKFDLMKFERPANTTSEAFQTIELIIDNKRIAVIKNTGFDIASDEDKANFTEIIKQMKSFVKEIQ